MSTVGAKEWRAHCGGVPTGEGFHSPESGIDPWLRRRSGPDGSERPRELKSLVREFSPQDWEPHIGGFPRGSGFHRPETWIDPCLRNRQGQDGTQRKPGVKSSARQGRSSEWITHCGGSPRGADFHKLETRIDPWLRHRPGPDGTDRPKGQKAQAREPKKNEWNPHHGGGSSFQKVDTKIDPWLRKRPGQDGTERRPGEKSAVRETRANDWKNHCGRSAGFYRPETKIDPWLRSRPGVDGSQKQPQKR